MPDPNKFERLREIGYEIPVTCSGCVHGVFNVARGLPTTAWGTCSLHRYQHQKHDNPDGGRGVSVHATGTCKDAEAASGWVDTLGAHEEFLVEHPVLPVGTTFFHPQQGVTVEIQSLPHHSTTMVDYSWTGDHRTVEAMAPAHVVIGWWRERQR